MPWLSSLRCGCWTWQRLHRPFQRRDLRPHGAGPLRRPLRQRGAQCPGLLRTGACAGLGSGFIGRFSDGTYGYTVLAYNGVFFGEGARRALASLAQMQVLDPAAASSAASTAGPTASRCWTTTASTSAKGHAVPWPPSHRCRCWTSQRLLRPLQRRDLRKRGAGLQRRPLRRRGAPCHGLLRTDASAGLGSGLIGRLSGGTYGLTVLDYNGVLFGEGARRALVSFAQVHVLDLAPASSAASTAGPTATRCGATTASSSAKVRTVPWPPTPRCRCRTWQRLHRLLQRRDLRLHSAGLLRRPRRRRGALCPGLRRTDAGAGPGSGLIDCFSGGTYGLTVLDYNGVLFGEGARRALVSFAQVHVLDLAPASSAASTAGPTATRCGATTASSSAKVRTVPWPPTPRCRCRTWQRLHRLLQRRDLRLHSAGLLRRPRRRRGALCPGLRRTDAGAGPGSGIIDCFSCWTYDCTVLDYNGVLFGEGTRSALASFAQTQVPDLATASSVASAAGPSAKERAVPWPPSRSCTGTRGVFIGGFDGGTFGYAALDCNGVLFGFLHAGADAGPGGGIIRGVSGGYGHAVLDFNGVFFGKGARRALASFAQVQAPDLAGTCPKHLIQSWATMRCLRGGAPNARSHGGASAACGSARLRTPARRLVAAAARPVATHSFHATGAVRKLAPFRLRRPCRSFRTCRRLSHRRRRR